MDMLNKAYEVLEGSEKLNEVAIGNIDKIIEMYRSKKSLSEIGEMYGLKLQGTGTFIHALRKIGVISDEDVEIRERALRTDKEKEISDRNRNIISDYENFVDMETIKSKYKISESTIRTILRNGDIELIKRSYRNLKYPKNLVFDIFGGIDFEIADDVEKGISFSFNTLNEREEKVLKEYYKDERTLKEIAKLLCLSVERIRQIKAKALRKLRKPQVNGYIKFGYGRYTEMIKEKKKEHQEKLKNKEIPDIKIDELGLSTRGYNCLKRAGVNTISDIKSKEQLMKIRNLGKSTYEEILQKIHSFGYEIPYESFD